MEHIGNAFGKRGVVVATFKCFEDIAAWQKARELTRLVYVKAAHSGLSRDFKLFGQMTSAAYSIMSNIAEGFERGGNPEFLQFLWIAKGSAGELRSLSYVAMDAGYIDESSRREIHALATDVSRMLSGLITYLREGEMKGQKYAGPA
jgi:four helix bundle protein